MGFKEFPRPLFVIDWRKSIRMQKYKIEKSEMPIIDEVILWLLRNAR